MLVIENEVQCFSELKLFTGYKSAVTNSISQTLFIDDFPQHVQGAEKTGLNGVLLAKDTSLSSIAAGLQLIKA